MDDTRLKKLRFRAWHRGFREADLILGPFADKHAQNLAPAQLEAFERLLDVETDHDIYGWIVGRAEAPAHIDPELMAMLRAFDPAERGAHGA
jgi:antitoxin CptB